METTAKAILARAFTEPPSLSLNSIGCFSQFWDAISRPSLLKISVQPLGILQLMMGLFVSACGLDVFEADVQAQESGRMERTDGQACGSSEASSQSQALL